MDLKMELKMETSMDWTKAIAINCAALARIVDEIFSLLELALTGKVANLPRMVQVAALRQLRPAESALRRLIVILARDVKVALPPHRPMPQGLVIGRKASSTMGFRLYDLRKRFQQTVSPAKEPRGPQVHFFGAAPLIPVLQAPTAQAQRATSSNLVQLCRRFEALKLALETLPRQAKRLARWRLRRTAKTDAKFTSPLRPGKPPGHQQRPILEVDNVLRACHGLASDVLAQAALRLNPS